MPTKKTSKKKSQIKDTMSSGTKDLIQKFCYKKTASVDMTKHGFIYDNKLLALSLLLRCLREKCEKIWGTRSEVLLVRNKKKISTRNGGRRQQNLDNKIPRTRNVKPVQKRVTTRKK